MITFIRNTTYILPVKNLVVAFLIVCTIAIVSTLGYVFLATAMHSPRAFSSTCYRMTLISNKGSLVLILHKCNCSSSRNVLSEEILKRVRVLKLVLRSEPGESLGCEESLDVQLSNGTIIVPCMPSRPGIYYPCIVLSNGEELCLKNMTIVVQP